MLRVEANSCLRPHVFICEQLYLGSQNLCTPAVLNPSSFKATELIFILKTKKEIQIQT